MSKLNIKGVISGEGTLYNGKISIWPPPGGVEFGKYCAIAQNLKIMGINHDYNFPAIQNTFYSTMFKTPHPRENNSNTYSKGKITIGNDVWIGEDVFILSGVTIGDGCCIGARSVIAKDLPPYTICVGQPCKPVKNRYNDNIRDFLLKLQWWNWDKERIQKNKAFFMTNLNTINDVNELEKIIC
jgi:virginiamycin A acetyltransferase